MSPTPLTAIALQTIRKAVRSRLAVSLLALTVILVAALPALLRDDGSPEGRYRVMLIYTLSACLGLIVPAALWSACASAATDIASRRLHLVVTKPVSALTLWCGQWLGLMLLYVALLLAVWILILGNLYWRPAGTSTPDGIECGSYAAIGPTARVIAPSPPPETALSPGAPRERLIIPPGHARVLEFELPRKPRADRAAALEIMFAASRSGTDGTSATHPLEFEIGGAARDRRVLIAGAFSDGMRHRIEPVSLEYAENNTLHVLIANPGVDPPVTLVFDQRQGIRLRVPAGGWPDNHLRAFAILTARLGVFVAAGLTAGTMFSFPVAAFAGGFLLLFASLSGYIRAVIAQGVLVVPHEGPMGDPSAPERFVLGLFRIFDMVLRPMSDPRPIGMLGSRELIDGIDVAIGFGILWPVYAGLLAVAGILALRRREFGLQ